MDEAVDSPAGRAGDARTGDAPAGEVRAGEVRADDGAPAGDAAAGDPAAGDPASASAPERSPYAATPAPGFRGGLGPGGKGVRGKERFLALVRSATIAATIAMPVNVGIYFAGQAAGADYRVTVAGTSAVQFVGLAPVVSETLIAILFGTLLLWPMTYLRGGTLVWLVLAVIVGVGSIAIPIDRALDGPSKAALASMHIVALLCTLAFPALTARKIGYE